MPIFYDPKDALNYVSHMERETEGVKCTITTTVMGEYKVICQFLDHGAAITPREIPPPTPVKFQQEKLIEHHIPNMVNLPPLYPYQEDAVRQALQDRHIIIEIPTGRGKTRIAMEIIQKARQPAIVIVPTILLMEQWQRAFRNAGLSTTSVSGSGVTFSHITVITYASATKYIPELVKYPVVVFDEVHHLFSPEYQKIVLGLKDAITPYLIGLTATVREFGEAKELQDQLFPNRFSRTITSFQENAETSVPIELTEQGIRMTDEEEEEYEKYTDAIRNALRRFGDIAGIQRAMSAQIPDTRKLAMLGMSAIARRKQLLSGITPKLDEAVRIINNNPGQFIVFAESIDSATYIHNSLVRMKVPSMLVHSNLKSDRLARERIMNDLRSRKARVLVGVISISEGIDLPDLSQAIIISPSVAGRRLYVQRLGRILRHRAGKRAHLWVLYAIGTIEERNLQKIRDLVGDGAMPASGRLF
jgi:superfamily II DNA or RNA helicase